ncbi:class I SAM-dependent DNA methyltransferase [Chryseomicrobium palamuruense]|uniref:Class I SAM-dependent DNA methyltransferase n=1 Tax=Chryseomicrobium palamuruense TaxID=682973 RepID=A0ABV8V093_9BACL
MSSSKWQQIKMYQKFATIYDRLMEDIPYENYLAWVSHETGGFAGKSVMELGCGTGTLAIGFAHLGAKVIGLDLSAEMIHQAKLKSVEEEVDVEFIQGSMTDFTVDQLLDIIVIPIDSLNYLESKVDIVTTFASIYRALKPGGHLFFDVHSLDKIEAYLDGPFIYEDDEVAYLWSTEPGEAEYSVYHDITFFVAAADGRYDRFEEHHYQRTFPVVEYQQLLQNSGFHSITSSDDVFGEEHEGLRQFIHAVK